MSDEWVGPTAQSVRGWRERAGLSQDELARTLRVARYTVRRWEEGKSPVPYMLGFALNYLGSNRERWVRVGRDGPEPPGAGVGISSAVGMRYAGGMEQRG